MIGRCSTGGCRADATHYVYSREGERLGRACTPCAAFIALDADATGRTLERPRVREARRRFARRTAPGFPVKA